MELMLGMKAKARCSLRLFKGALTQNKQRDISIIISLIMMVFFSAISQDAPNFVLLFLN
jgi:hypothetical protein